MPARKKNPKQPAKRVRRALAKYVKAQKPAAGRKQNPPAGRAKRPRKNPTELEAAAELSERFHGRPAHSIRDITELEHTRETLADLGRLVEMTVWLDEDRPFLLTFKGVRLAASPDGGQLYLIGNQRLDLAALGLDRYLPKDHVNVGAVSQVVYHTSKAFHDFAPIEYKHDFGEDDGEAPMLGYDVLSEKFYLTGGSYQVLPAGIEN